jgi:dolichyl-diphosphooligosaccharide--protein glycosyltransferase
MRLPKALSKERIANGLKNFGKLRIKTSHSSMLTFSILLLVLFIAFVIRMFPLRWEIQAGAIHLSEFDPYYQYSLTKYMVDHGLVSPYWPSQWRDYQRWYPGGINMGNSLSSLPMTAAFFYDIISALGVNVDLMSYCAVIPVIMGTIAVLIIYFLGKDLGGKAVGMLAALFLALDSSLIQRTALGFFDTETVGIVSLLLFSILFLRAIEEERPIGSSVKYSLGSAAALAYFVMGWGAAYYLIGLTVLFVFVLLVIKRYTRRLFVVYSLTFGLGLLIAMNNPYISTHYLTSFAVLPVAGMFVLLCLSEILRNLTSAREKVMFAIIFLATLVGSFIVVWRLGYMSNIAGKFLDVLDPFLRSDSPLVESVAEHRISAWGSVYFDLGIGILFFLVGLFFAARNLNNKNLFLVIFGLTTLYFASSMVRLLALMAPAFSLLAAVGIIGLLKPFYTLLREAPKIVTKKKLGLEHVGKEFSGVAVFLIFLILMTNLVVSPQSGGMPKVYRQAYAPITITAGSLPIAPNEPVREWLDELKYLNDFKDSTIVVCSWWDYGYWLTMLGNVTSLADNATINGTQIENIGFIFMANETQAVKMLAPYNSKYILVFTTVNVNSGEWVGWGDEGKWMWMAKISGNAMTRFVNGDTNGDGIVDIPNLIDEASSWTNESKFGNYTTEGSWTWNNQGTNSTIYKLMSYGKHQWNVEWSVGQTTEWAEPIYFKEAYFAGKDLSPEDASSKYGGVVPLICLYEIDWQKYHNDYPTP